jgi:ABC-type nitrate/sulfonate/bicarbonate transport system substrate-binding protein
VEGLAMIVGFDELKKKFLASVLVVSTVVPLSVIPAAKEACAEQLRVGVNRGVHSALIYLAEAQSFFKKQGIDVAIKEYEAGVLAVNDLIVDKLDVAPAAEFAFVMQSFKHRDLRMPASICIGSDVDIIVRKDRGIVGPQDLRGKRVAVARGGQTEFFLYNYLIFNRIPAESVQVVDHTPSQMVRAVVDGTVDAALCWPPYTIEMSKRLGSKGDRWPAQSGQNYYQVLFAKEGFLKQQPKMIEKFLAALSEAEKYIAKYPERTQAFLRDRLKIEHEILLLTWPLYRFKLQLTQDLIVLMEREATWAMRNNLVEKREMPNYLDFFYFDALDKVKPEAVTVVH